MTKKWQQSKAKKSYYTRCRACLDRIRTELLVAGYCRACRNNPWAKV